MTREPGLIAVTAEEKLSFLRTAIMTAANLDKKRIE